MPFAGRGDLGATVAVGMPLTTYHFFAETANRSYFSSHDNFERHEEIMGQKRAECNLVPLKILLNFRLNLVPSFNLETSHV